MVKCLLFLYIPDVSDNWLLYKLQIGLLDINEKKSKLRNEKKIDIA